MTGAGDLLAAAGARGWTVGVAESLTGGALAAELVETPGASQVVRGAVVAYATELKASLLGVDGVLLAERGAVDADVAAQMASGARRITGADVGLSTTGVAGPAPQDGVPPGVVFVAVETPDARAVQRCDLPGDRTAVRRGAVDAVLRLAVELLQDSVAVEEG